MLKITVIIPVYNTADTLPKCLDSVLGQHFQNTEILLIDDASTDGSGAICDAYAAKDERITVIRHETNRGAAAARNTGLENATGDFVYFLDSDLWIEPGCLTRLAKTMVDADAEMSICTYVIEHEGKRAPNYFSFTPFGTWTASRWVDRNVSADTDEANEKLWNRMFKRQLFAGMRFDESNRYAEIALLPELTESCSAIISFNRVLIHYKKRSETKDVIESGAILQKLTAYDRQREIYDLYYPDKAWYVDRLIVRHCLKILKLRAAYGTGDALEAGIPDVLDRLLTLSGRKKVCDMKLKRQVFLALKMPGLFSALARSQKNKI